MAEQGDFVEDAHDRKFTGPYTSKHPIPTIQKYREHRDELQQQQSELDDEGVGNDDKSEGRMQRALDSAMNVLGKGETEHLAGDPYPTHNRYEQSQQNTSTSGGESDYGKGTEEKPEDGGESSPDPPKVPQKDQKDSPKASHANSSNGQSATEAAASHSDPRKKRKAMKNIKRNDGGREVTDPVTHLPVMIYDSTDKDLKKAPENEAQYGSGHRTSTGLSGATKSQSQLDVETRESQDVHQGIQRLFPPPQFDDAEAELIRTYQFALTVGIGSVTTLAALVLIVWQLLNLKQQNRNLGDGDHENWVRIFIPVLVVVVLSALAGTGITWGIRGWLGKKVEEIWEDEVWDAARSRERNQVKNQETPESTQWLNSLLASVWPLINPDLFAGLVDTLEDVMQASLPKLVRMISIDDLGQGSEAIRILGVRWLPTGAASQSVSLDGKLKSAKDEGKNDRNAPGEGQIERDDENSGNEKDKENKKTPQQKKQEEEERESTMEGMEAEQGDFVNMEIGFAYRARSSGKSLKTKAKNAHLYLRFYLPGGIALPVWVEVRGLIGTMRIRLQLTPDPPFFSLATITFLGQPKADLSCVPLNKHNLNLMDVPLLSTFVQSSIDAALAEYVAPKSLTLDLKDMLLGDDFKKDTVARGVVVVYIKKARDFKEGDGSLGPFKEGSSDGYVTCGFAKFAKPIASTRIILNDQRPTWNEWSYILVGPEELNADELLQLQLWDSDRTTADDALGRVEVPLKSLMKKYEGSMHDREDRLMGENEEKMPGTLQWSVGYFPKTRITEEQLANQTEDPDIKSIEDLKKRVSETAERKLREATSHDESKEIHQQKVQDYKEREDALIISSPPSTQYHGGILSIQVHNITGLELEKLRKERDSTKDSDAAEDEAEQSDDLPSSYCTVIVNQSKIFKTRTKPKNAKPFFNAGTERFIRDWRTTEVILTVRDSRVHENDPLLGVVYLPLAHVFKHRSQTNDTYPLAGGIGYGRARISMVFRSVELQAPKELLGWDYGTLEIKGPIKAHTSLPSHVKQHRMKLRSTIMRAKMRPGDDGEWMPKHSQESVFLAVRKRYATPLVLEFRKSTFGPDSTPAFAVLWLKDIPDDEEQKITMQVWKGGKANLKRAETCGDYNGMEDGEKPLGEIDVTMEFHHGLSGYHKKIASDSKEQDLKDVMEALDTVHEVQDDDDPNGDSNNDSSSSSDDDNDETNGEHHHHHSLKHKTNTALKTTDNPATHYKNGDSSSNKDHHPHGIKERVASLLDGHNDASDGSRGPLQQVYDYKDHHKQLHRHHRGIMQWKGARTIDWMMTKASHGKDHVKDAFGHSEREPTVETEV